MRAFAVAACLASAVAVVKGTAVGPVVLVVSEQRGWGVHVGDAAALLPLAAAAWLCSAR